MFQKGMVLVKKKFVKKETTSMESAFHSGIYRFSSSILHNVHSEV